jgi:carboxylesterase type B
MGTLHGLEIPFVMNVPSALVGPDKVTPTDEAMAALTSAYWVYFGLTGDPKWRQAAKLATLRSGS